MTDNVTSKLILEHLKAIQAKLVDLASDMSDMKADMRDIKGHMASFMQSEVAQDGSIAALQTRLDRIELRLSLTEAGEAWTDLMRAPPKAGPVSSGSLDRRQGRPSHLPRPTLRPRISSAQNTFSDRLGAAAASDSR